MGKDNVSSENGNYLIEAMNCLTTIEHFHFDLESTMGLDLHIEMFDRLQPFFRNNPIKTFELDRFEFYKGNTTLNFDVKKEKKFIRGLKTAIQAANVKCLRFSDENHFSVRGAIEILSIVGSCPSIKDFQLFGIGSDVHRIKVLPWGPDLRLEYVVPALLKRGRLANLQTLWLFGDDMGRDGLIELLDVLPDNDTLKDSTLLSTEDECVLDDALLEKIGNTMGRNRTLEKLSVRINRNRCTPGGLNCLERLLCNTESVDGTFESNHSLTEVGLGRHVGLPGARILNPLYEINEKFKRNEAAILKVLIYHDLLLAPLVVRLSYPADFECNVRRLLIFVLLQHIAQERIRRNEFRVCDLLGHHLATGPHGNLEHERTVD